MHLSPDAAIRRAAAQIKSFVGAIGETRSVASEVRRVLHNQEIAEHLINHFDATPPDFVYERLSLFSTAGVLVARALGRPIVIEMNARLAQEQATYRAAGLTELASASERWVLANATHVVVVSERCATMPLHAARRRMRFMSCPTASIQSSSSPRRVTHSCARAGRCTTGRCWVLSAACAPGMMLQSCPGCCVS